MKKIVFGIWISMFTLSCNKESTVQIVGSIPNLPNGTMYLFKDFYSKVDSSKVKNGQFQIVYKYNGSVPYIGIYHVNNKNDTIYFSYLKEEKNNGSKHFVDRFMADSLVTFTGNLKVYDIFKKNKGIKVYNITLADAPVMKYGRQTKTYYSLEPDFFYKVNPNLVKEKISQYPYSYHLLYELEKNKNRYSASQIERFLQLFDKDVKKSDAYKKLMTYAEKKEKAKLKTPLLEDINGEKVTFIDPKYDKHLIVFWASWCGPCREEIPFLKKAYESKGSKLEFISISIDKDKTAWKIALDKEQMPWKQFVVNEKEAAYEDLQILFKFNNYIPYTILLDNNMKILASSTGLSSTPKKDLKDMLSK